MKKRTILSFLAMLCLVGSAIYGQRLGFDPDLFGPAGPDVAYNNTSHEPAPEVIYGTVNSDFPSEDVVLTYRALDGTASSLGYLEDPGLVRSIAIRGSAVGIVVGSSNRAAGGTRNSRSPDLLARKS
jgi:hypothetical protein